MNSSVKVALCQMLVEGGMPEANMTRAEEMIRRAAGKGAEVAVLPECLDLGWTHPSAGKEAEPIPGPRFSRLAQAAADAGIAVVAGLTERSAEGVYNASVLISPPGALLLKHRKINVLSIAHDLYRIGDSLGVADAGFAAMGISICADNFPNSLAIAHVLARMGARIVLSPCAWAVDADHDNREDPYGEEWVEAYTRIARLYRIPVVGVSNVGPVTAGPWAGKKCIGASIAVTPEGLLYQAPYGEHAEDLAVLELPLVPAEAKGTDIAGMLERKGYTGP